MHLNLIWTLTPRSLAEDDWIHWLFQDFDIVDHVAPRWNLFQDNSIRFLWSFAGFKRATRISMFENLKHVEPHKCYLYDGQSQQPWLDRAEFRALLSDSVFSPCPMGNTVLESFRIYESLEMGCIPILEHGCHITTV
jgi:hypothetical protein